MILFCSTYCAQSFVLQSIKKQTAIFNAYLEMLIYSLEHNIFDIILHQVARFIISPLVVVPKNVLKVIPK